jgi:hypothetical protein
LVYLLRKLFRKKKKICDEMMRKICDEMMRKIYDEMMMRKICDACTC